MITVSVRYNCRTSFCLRDRQMNVVKQTEAQFRKTPNSSGWAVFGSFRKLWSTSSLSLAAHCPSSPLWTTLECWSTAGCRCVTMCNGSAVCRITSFASSAQSWSTGHFSWTRLDPAKRWPDPTRDCRQKVWPDPTRGPSLPPFVHSLIE